MDLVRKIFKKHKPERKPEPESELLRELWAMDGDILLYRKHATTYFMLHLLDNGKHFEIYNKSKFHGSGHLHKCTNDSVIWTGSSRHGNEVEIIIDSEYHAMVRIGSALVTGFNVS